MTLTRTRRLGALAFAAVFAVGACSGGSSPSPSSAAPSSAAPSGSAATSEEPSAEPLTGEVSISGSSTVLPISQGVQELFNETQPDVAVAVDGPGTGDGMKLFCAGEIDIADASRKMKADETEAGVCETNGIEFVELKVAIDGLSILTSPANSGVTCLSYADLYAMIGPESEGVDTWNGAQALATELGSTTTLPSAPLKISGPGEESGTYDYFVEQVITPIAGDRGKESVTRKDYDSSPNDNVIIQGIEGSDTSLGWVGYAYAVENKDNVKLIEVAKEPGKCVAPTPETIASNEYPLSRDLYIYVNKAKAEANPAVAAFVDFYLAEGTIAKVNEAEADGGLGVGYIDLAPEVLAESRTAWEGR